MELVLADGPCGIPQLDKAPGGGRTVAEGNRELNTPLDYDLMRTDFDFEANLALFDKQRVSREAAGRMHSVARAHAIDGGN